MYCLGYENQPANAIIALYFEMETKHRSELRGGNVEFLNVERGGVLNKYLA
jgi:hypothetical protein